MNPELPAPPQPEPPETGPVPVRTVPADQVFILGEPESRPLGAKAAASPSGQSRSRLALILFLLTCLSTFLTGFMGIGEPLFSTLPSVLLSLLDGDFRRYFLATFPAHLKEGFVYSGCVMAILGAHEMGHYLQARRYGVPASFPFFIPFPISPFGTMGAVIVQQSGVANRKSMFDIAISGPLAGLVVALPVTYFGIKGAKVLEITGPGAAYGDPLLLKWMYQLIPGGIPAGSDVIFNNNPLLFAGWVGIFITALNLIPIGQLDGGHILYCLIGRRAHYVARGLFLVAATVVVYSIAFGDRDYMGWSLMLFLIWIFGTRHPPTANDRMPLGPLRVVLGWLTLMFIIIGLTPTPMYFHEGKPEPKRSAPIERQPEQEIRI